MNLLVTKKEREKRMKEGNPVAAPRCRIRISEKSAKSTRHAQSALHRIPDRPFPTIVPFSTPNGI